MAPSLDWSRKHPRFSYYNPLTGKSEKRTIKPWEYDSEGTEKRRRETAERFLLTFLGQEPDHRTATPKNIRFLAYAEKVIASHNIGESTRETYLRDIRLHMTSLHLKPVASIKYVHIRDLISELLKKPKPPRARNGDEPYSPNSLKNVRSPLSLILDEAVREGILVSNPCSLGKWPTAEEVEVRILKPEELPALLDAAIDYHRYGKAKYAAMIGLALFAGLRKGEIIRLTWKDIDFKRKLIHLRKKDRTRKLKNPNAARPVEMPEVLLDILWKHRLEFQENELDLVFPSSSGRPLSDSNVHKIVTDILLRSGLWDPESSDPERQLKPTLHKLRHNHASVLAVQGVDLKYSAAQMGHARVDFMLDRYAHVIQDVSRGTAAAAVDAHWSGTETGQKTREAEENE